MGKKLVLMFLGILVLIILSCLVLSLGNDSSGKIIKPDGSASWESNIGLFEIDQYYMPCKSSSYINITSYLPTQNLDFCIRVSRPIDNGAVYVEKNMAHQIIVGTEYINTTICNDNCSESGYNENIYEEDWYLDWSKLGGVNVYHYGDYYYYCSLGNNIIKDNQYKIKVDFEFPLEHGGCSEEWGFLGKRTSDSLSYALMSGNYIELDPVSNSSYNSCANILGFVSGNVNEPVYLDLSSLGYTDEKMKTLTLTSGTCDGGTASSVEYDFAEDNPNFIVFIYDGSSSYSINYGNSTPVYGSYNEDLFLIADPFDQYTDLTNGSSLNAHWMNTAATNNNISIGGCPVGTRCMTSWNNGNFESTYSPLKYNGLNGLNATVIDDGLVTVVYKSIFTAGMGDTVGRTLADKDDLTTFSGAGFYFAPATFQVTGLDGAGTFASGWYLTPLLNDTFKTTFDTTASTYSLTYTDTEIVSNKSCRPDCNNADLFSIQYGGASIGKDTFFIDDVYVILGVDIQEYNTTSILSLQVNAIPVCTESDTNITIDEDTGAWELDNNMSLPINISCTDSDGDSLTYSFFSQTGTAGTFTNPNNDDLIYTTGVNLSGTDVAVITVSDGSGSTYVSAQVIVTNLPDPDWFDPIPNNTLTIAMDTPNQNVTLNWMDYWHDVEDTSPSEWDVYSNTTDVPCVKSSGDIVCSPTNNFRGNVILIIDAQDSDAINATVSTEIIVDNPSISFIEEAVTSPQISTGLYEYSVNVTYNNYRVSDINCILNMSNLTYALSKEVINSTVTRFYASIGTPESFETQAIPYSWNITTTESAGDISNSSYGGAIDIYKLELNVCNSTDTFPFLNFSFKDESDGTSINASIPSSSFTYSIDSAQTITKTYTYSETVENISLPICVYPADVTVYADIELSYKNTEYAQRMYQADDLALTNSSNNMTLYLLKTTEGIYTTFQVVNTANQPIADVLVRYEYPMGTVIESRYTDAAGGATFFVDPDTTYTFTFSKAGYDTRTFSLAPTQSSYTVTMGGTTGTTDNYNLGVSYTILPDTDVLMNETAYAFNITLISTYYTLQETGFTISANNTILGSASCTTSGCTANIALNTGNYTQMTMDYYWKINNTYTNGTRSWSVTNLYVGKSSFAKFFEDVKKIANTFDGGEDSTDWKFTKAIIAFIVILLSVGSVAYITGIYSPLAISGTAFGATIFLDMAGFIPNIGIVDNFITVVIGLIFFGTIIEELMK